MKVRINEGGYITDYALIGNIDGGIEIPAPDDMEHFCRLFRAYAVKDGKPVFEEAVADLLEQKELIDGYRRQREQECFAIMDRGPYWYKSLSEQQSAELEAWYRAWLDVTETKVVPNKPDWL